MKILVCGGRDYSDWGRINEVLSSKVTYRDTIIHGDALGADRLAGKWAKEVGVQVLSYPADWEKYPKAAGPIRNQQMLDEGKPDLVIAFPGGRGTADMVRRAKKAGIKVIEIN